MRLSCCALQRSLPPSAAQLSNWMGFISDLVQDLVSLSWLQQLFGDFYPFHGVSYHSFYWYGMVLNCGIACCEQDASTVPWIWIA